MTETALADAYLLMWYRSTPGLTGDPCTRVGVWMTLEGAQTYSTECGGIGEWEYLIYDGGENWIRKTADAHLNHMIEGLALMDTAPAVAGQGG